MSSDVLRAGTPGTMRGECLLIRRPGLEKWPKPSEVALLCCTKLLQDGTELAKSAVKKLVAWQQSRTLVNHSHNVSGEIVSWPLYRHLRAAAVCRVRAGRPDFVSRPVRHHMASGVLQLLCKDVHEYGRLLFAVIQLHCAPCVDVC